MSHGSIMYSDYKTFELSFEILLPQIPKVPPNCRSKEHHTLVVFVYVGFHSFWLVCLSMFNVSLKVLSPDHTCFQRLILFLFPTLNVVFRLSVPSHCYSKAAPKRDNYAFSPTTPFCDCIFTHYDLSS